MFFTTNQTASIAGCTLRQLQYWRLQEIIVPTVPARGKGRSVYYTRDDAVGATVLFNLITAGLGFSSASNGFKQLVREVPNFLQPTCTDRYFLTKFNLEPQLIAFMYEQRFLQQALDRGSIIIPVWMDKIQTHINSQIKLL